MTSPEPHSRGFVEPGHRLASDSRAHTPFSMPHQGRTCMCPHVLLCRYGQNLPTKRWIQSNHPVRTKLGQHLHKIRISWILPLSICPKGTPKASFNWVHRSLPCTPFLLLSQIVPQGRGDFPRGNHVSEGGKDCSK